MAFSNLLSLKMPIFWRTLSSHFLKVFFLCVLSFIAILLVLRLEEIAYFATLGAKKSYLILFVLYQIPFILPLAIPISCLISAMILFQKLSSSHELTAWRSCGFSLKTLLSPILICSLALTIGNFFVTSELATASRLATRKMIYELSSVNPLLLLQNAKVAKLKGSYIHMQTIKNSQFAKDVIIAVNNHSQKRLNLFLAKEIEVIEDQLNAKNVALVSALKPSKTDMEIFDSLVIENQGTMSSSAPEFASFLKKQSWKIANDHLTLNLLRLKIDQLNTQFSHEKVKDDNPSYIQYLKRAKTRCYSEIIRRLSLAFAAITFTLMGSSFALEISRQKNKRGLLAVSILTSFSLVAFFIGKEFDDNFSLSLIFFFCPHLLIILSSLYTMKRINEGREA